MCVYILFDLCVYTSTLRYKLIKQHTSVPASYANYTTTKLVKNKNKQDDIFNKMQRVGFALNKQGEEGSKDKTGRNTDETRLDMS